MKEAFGRIDKQLESVASGHGDIHVIAQLSEEALMFHDLAMKKHVQISDLHTSTRSAQCTALWWGRWTRGSMPWSVQQKASKRGRPSKIRIWEKPIPLLAKMPLG